MSLLDYEGLLKRKKPVAEKEKTENPLPLNLEKQLPTVSSSPKEDTARSNVEVVPKKRNRFSGFKSLADTFGIAVGETILLIALVATASFGFRAFSSAGNTVGSYLTGTTRIENVSKVTVGAQVKSITVTLYGEKDGELTATVGAETLRDTKEAIDVGYDDTENYNYVQINGKLTKVYDAPVHHTITRYLHNFDIPLAQDTDGGGVVLNADYHMPFTITDWYGNSYLVNARAKFNQNKGLYSLSVTSKSGIAVAIRGVKIEFTNLDPNKQYSFDGKLLTVDENGHAEAEIEVDGNPFHLGMNLFGATERVYRLLGTGSDGKPEAKLIFKLPVVSLE